MNYHSAFDIIGPVMVGPSSSHTAGAVRIGRLARFVLGEMPTSAVFRLMGSFAETYEGHGGDCALLAGVLGMDTGDSDVPKAKRLAEKADLHYAFEKAHLGSFHPNTVAVDLKGAHHSITMVASSIGGGKIEAQALDGLPLKFSGETPTLILRHRDERGFLAHISRILDAQSYNISRLQLERYRPSGDAITVCEIDEHVRNESVEKLQSAIHDLARIQVIQ